MKAEIHPKADTDSNNPANLHDFEEAKKNMNWDTVKKDLVFFDGKLNAAYNAVDRHLETHRKDKLALLFIDDTNTEKRYTFTDLSKASNKAGNLLKTLGVTRGDRVFLFLPRIPELFFSFLGILKIGAISGTMFSAFQEQALQDRLENSEAKIVITTPELLPRIEKIKGNLPALQHILIVGSEDYTKRFNEASEELTVEQMDPEDYAFMLYTSGTTGKPKGVMHAHRAIIQQYITAKWILDLHEDDMYWCTADPGWVTGIAYEILGNLACGTTSLIFSGRFSTKKWYELLQNYKVNVWYTAPTAIRMLMADGKDLVKQYDLSHLRHMCSVGEPLNPEAIKWGLEAFGKAFHDTWWQTECGAMMIVNYRCMDIKIGSMGKPVPGVEAGIVDDNGNELGADQEGNIAIRPGWPGMMKAIWKRPEKFDSYFVNNWYMSGDRGWKDNDGYFWFIGRADDVIKTSGERVGPFEVESALVEHPAVTEAGVIGKPDALRGEIIKAFVVLSPEYKQKVATKEDETKLIEELSQHVKKHLAGHAYPREIEFIDKLPKTRSGKIMRRILKAKELGAPIGDTSTLEDY